MPITATALFLTVLVLALTSTGFVVARFMCTSQSLGHFYYSPFVIYLSSLSGDNNITFSELVQMVLHRVLIRIHFFKGCLSLIKLSKHGLNYRCVANEKSSP
jgi:uncharacterized protein YqfA (UPF0365 family)